MKWLRRRSHFIDLLQPVIFSHFERRCNLRTKKKLQTYKFGVGIQYQILWHLPRPREKKKNLILKPNVEAICIIHGAHHDTRCIMENVEWKVPACSLDRRWERESRWHERRWREEGEERWALMNARRRTGLHPRLFLTPSPVLSTTFRLFLTL